MEIYQTIHFVTEDIKCEKVSFFLLFASCVFSSTQFVRRILKLRSQTDPQRFLTDFSIHLKIVIIQKLFHFDISLFYPKKELGFHNGRIEILIPSQM